MVWLNAPAIPQLATEHRRPIAKQSHCPSQPALDHSSRGALLILLLSFGTGCEAPRDFGDASTSVASVDRWYTQEDSSVRGEQSEEPLDANASSRSDAGTVSNTTSPTVTVGADDAPLDSGITAEVQEMADAAAVVLSEQDGGLEPSSPRIGDPCEPEARHVCDPAARSDSLLCSQGHWTFDERCDAAERCSPEHGMCEPVSRSCGDGGASDSYCDGIFRVHCDQNALAVVDACEELCIVTEAGATCGSSTCGDGRTEGFEQCDDGNTFTEVDCPYGSPSCVACDAECAHPLELSGPYCGDGKVNGEEICDVDKSWCNACEITPAVAAGLEHSCALSSYGAVQCWGRNNYGQLGDGSTYDSSAPVGVVGMASAVAAIVAGGHHTCVLLLSGGVHCWGLNDNGQLGTNSTTNSPVPVEVSGLDSGAARLAAGRSHTCVALEDGAVSCWGDGSNGQLANGSFADRWSPVTVFDLGGAASEVAAGGHHTCALLAGRVQCWGTNGSGQLGDGSLVSSATPVWVGSSTPPVTAIAAGSNHTCALSELGTIECWGSNSYGQLGNNTLDAQPTPTNVYGLMAAIDVAAGGYHTCATLGTGAVRCWGYNTYGQLGNSSTAHSSVPVSVSGLTNGVISVALGAYHTCAVKTAERLQCWGSNLYGQLGNESGNAPFPVDVLGLFQ